MNKKILLELGIPIAITNEKGRIARIELNKDECVVCRYSADNSCYLNDAPLAGWYPEDAVKRSDYFTKLNLNKSQ